MSKASEYLRLQYLALCGTDYNLRSFAACTGPLPKGKRLSRAAGRRFYRKLLAGLQRDGLIFDIGANMGAKTDIFLRLGARVVSVEPDDACRTYYEIGSSVQASIASGYSRR